MDRREFFKLMEAGLSKMAARAKRGIGAVVGSRKATGEAVFQSRKASGSAVHVGRSGNPVPNVPIHEKQEGFLAKHGGKIAGAAALAGMGGLAFMRRRAGKRAAKPLSRLKAAGHSALSAIKANPKKALAAGAAGAAGLMFMRRKP